MQANPSKDSLAAHSRIQPKMLSVWRFPGNVTPPLLKGSLSSFNSVMGVTLVSRMVLNLRNVATEVHEDSHPSWSMSQSFSHPNFRANPEIELDSIKAAAPGPVRVWRADSELDSRGAVIDISNSMHVDEERDAAYC
ncbi:hypothetical protein HWV62_12634 [Athelia sp. TMB]|nr:hypothetical protein HWV62_12634 [Athelia sp. TMB]